ncbi:hypothetical protein QYS49_00275 [Marivirga salinae]|uniref:Peptidase E n=1 Tax=Marivirga salinarum TaxID=3059078 RepID=A0AA49JBI8_9BACT|nr:DUF6702 family protein [Marivirga sp. BDSF4-3]WKK75939.1 hypothetical protein QYS49_00275 [Marivirga sp. BDSF4-3]
MLYSNFIIGFFWMLSGMLHPFYVSITDLVYKEDAKSVQIMHKVFVDDFEQTLNKHYNVRLDILAMENTSEIDEMVKDYYSKRFAVSIDGKEKEITYIGSELEENVLWVYQEIYKVRKPKKFRITNTVLFDEFDTQSNLVHTDLGGEIKTLRLTEGDGTQEVEFDFY